MGKRTSVYLADDLAAAVDKTGLPLAELVRRGIYGPAAKPVVVPLRKPADAVVVPAGDAPADPPADVGSTPVPESWRCGCCHHLQAVGSVSHCEFCGSHRGLEVPR
jgi:hypothetical protein